MPDPITWVALAMGGGVLLTGARALLRAAFPPPRLEPKDAWLITADGDSRLVHHNTEQTVTLDDHTVLIGTARYPATQNAPATTTPFVTVLNPANTPPLSLPATPTTDIEHALHQLAPDHLEVQGSLLRLQIPPSQPWQPTAHHLIRIAHGLIHGEAWVDWLADSRDYDRIERHTLLLRALSTRYQARAIAPRYLQTPDPALRAWAALCLDTQAALERALGDTVIPAELHRQLFNARFHHGVAGFDSSIAAALHSDDLALVQLAIKCTNGLPLETARSMLNGAFPLLLSAARADVLQALALRDSAAAAQLAFGAFDTEDATLARVAVETVLAGLSPTEVTLHAIPLLTGNPLAAENAADVLAKVGTLDAIMPLRALAERTQFSHDMVAFTANAAIEAIQARADGQLGGLAISPGQAGELALSTKADEPQV